MNRPRVSIGLPVYNGQRYMEAALSALLAQTFTDFELVISDNASTDRTSEICQKYAAADPRVRYYRNETNLGANPNFNRVLELSRGEYFRWAAYDDVCMPQYLARCVEALDSDRKAVLAHTRTTIIDEAGNFIDTHPDALAKRGILPHEIDDPPRQLDSAWPVTRFRDLLLKTKWCFEIFGLMRREMVLQTGGHADFYGTDKVILAYLALQGRFVEVPEKLFLRRHHPQQSSSLKSAKQRALWSGAKKAGGPLASQKRCLAGYLNAIHHAPLSPAQRLGCYGVIAAYVSQPNKWADLLGLKRRRRIDLAHLPPTEQLLASK